MKFKFYLALIVAIVGFLPAMATTDYLEIPNVNIAPGQTVTMQICLENETVFSGFQLDLVLPEGITIPEDEYGDPNISLVAGRIADQTIACNYRTTNTLAIVAYSSRSRNFKGNSGPLLEIPITAASDLEGPHEVKVENIIFATSTAEEYPLANATGYIICNVEATSIELSVNNLKLTIGSTSQLIATVLPTNASDKTVTWTSSNVDVATVDATGKVTAVAVGTAIITATCGSVSATCSVTVNPIVATSVNLNKTSLELLIGASETLTATVAPANATDKTITWSSSNSSVATVDASGKVTAIAVGAATITATCGSVSATCDVTINPTVATSVTLNKTSLELLVGASETLTATVAPANATDKTITWSSSNSSVATVDASGKVTAIAVGNATITATCGSVSATCAVTIKPIVATSVTLNKTSLTLKEGESETLIATVTPDNITDKTVEWTSSNTSIATVDAAGKVSAVAIGTASITATCGSVSANCQVTVASNVVPVTSITLNKTSLDLLIGASETLTATVAPANATVKTVTWTSSNSSIATVDAKGKVTAVSAGTATITASCGTVSATCAVTVSSSVIAATSITLNKTSLSLKEGESETLTAIVAPENTTDKTVTWTSSNASIATVDANGKVTAVSVGNTIITASCGSVSATCAVTVTKLNEKGSKENPYTVEEIRKGDASGYVWVTGYIVGWISGTTISTTQFNGDATVQSNIVLASHVDVDNISKIIPVALPSKSTARDDLNLQTNPNNYRILVKLYGNAEPYFGVNDLKRISEYEFLPDNPDEIPVTSIILDKTSLELTESQTAQLTATVTPDDATDKTVTWTSSNDKVATVNVKGNVTAVSVGTVTITATCGSVSATCTVTVNPIVATSVILNKTSLELLMGTSETLVATVSPANTTDKTVTWESSDETVAIVNSKGLVTALAEGTATITATCGTVSAICEVSVKSDSGIENVSGDSFSIRVEESEIVIEGLGDDELVQVFTLDGKLVYSSCERRIALQAGAVYIVVYPEGARKIKL